MQPQVNQFPNLKEAPVQNVQKQPINNKQKITRSEPQQPEKQLSPVSNHSHTTTGSLAQKNITTQNNGTQLDNFIKKHMEPLINTRIENGYQKIQIEHILKDIERLKRQKQFITELEETLDKSVFILNIKYFSNSQNKYLTLKVRIGPFDDLYEIVDSSNYYQMRSKYYKNMTSNYLEDILIFWSNTKFW
ncbi:hypothetical protein PPERSA_04751 [Pseudocohnilembus persalinus]|uniref:Uncharacterized protein n=1 Tax=Pseudocohnilembus persalinus TaxID=266149 RepID=A0A0V0QP43_PSEPJ|nr:hypothetical protein PPERSA_04751 [Pseudocohnilembus persalinus]|eukprot:KRX03873.1 hypothetical protein PPERSA_04751 [Pseudocohnilembus persalinus]